MKYSKWICSEVTILKKCYLCYIFFSVYGSLNPNNLNTFFEEMTTSLDKGIVG